MRAARRLLSALALGAVLTGLGAGPAQAAGYRYWSFWQGGAGGTWAYATQGPATARPADGDVTGYRFSVSEDSADSSRPRTAPDFAALCAAVPAKDGMKRVGVVVDFGTPADAPKGETPPEPKTGCAQVAPEATAAEALAAVAKPLRYNDQALLCGIAGYPRTGCGEQVAEKTGSAPAASSPSPAASAADGNDDGGPSVGAYAGIVAVAALAGGALWQARRRRQR
ncbi:SCO2322 family protein [Streptomyces purpureus]|uniref:SCO2322 family protein n=1 Tax=Streptomyces purpureus TaxID=1951 RepID=UPI00378DA44D